ncbi:MAG: hypothetical protein M3Q96_06335, partial [Pseudomonadota bacterium]|nr:hypothetical protein [Pseudomonadota bacterium]
TCTASTLASGSSADFAVDVVAGDALGGKTLRMAAAVASSITDPANGNNQAATSVEVTASADLSLQLSGPDKKLHFGRTETFPLTLRNAGPDAAWQPAVTLRGDAPAANVSIAAPAGWQCAVVDIAGGFEARCTFDAAFAVGASQRFDVAILIPARPNSTMQLSLSASASASTPEPNATNNTATYTNRIVGVP